MTTEPAAIQASLVDVRNINSDKEVRLELRVPAELAGKVFAAFGWPTRVSPVPVVIARLEIPAEQAFKRLDAEAAQVVERTGEHRSFIELRRSAQAALRCREPLFQEFLRTRGHPCVHAEDAAVAVRRVCAVDSRAEFDSVPAAAQRWDGLEAAYYAWSHGRH